MQATCRGKSLLVQLASLSATLTNRARQLAHHLVCSIETAASPNLAYYDYFLVGKSIAAFAIFRGQCQDSPSGLQLLLVDVPERHQLFAAGRRPEPSIRWCPTSYLVHRSSRLHPPIPVESICRDSSASAEIFPCASGPLW